MRKLGLFDVGSSFRPAHPRQRSCNGLPMPRSEVFQVVKVFSMAPGIRMCAGRTLGGSFTLYPDTPVLLPEEVDPSEEEVQKFLLGKVRRSTVGYRLNYAGQGRDWLVSQLPKSVATIIEYMYVTGIKEFTVEKVKELLDRNGVSQKFTDYDLFYTHRSTLHKRGIVEVLYSDPPEIGAVLSEVIGQDAL